MRKVGEGGEYPRLDDSEFGVRPIRFLDTGERADIITIDGEPAALEPSQRVVEEWCERRLLEVVSRETLRDLRRRANEAESSDLNWRSLLALAVLMTVAAFVFGFVQGLM